MTSQKTRYSRPIFIPNLRIFSLFILLCGIVAIWSVLSPATLDSTFPGLREHYGGLILIGIVLGLLRSALNLLFRLGGLAFWVTALFCILGHQIAPMIPYDSMSDLSPYLSNSAVTKTLPRKKLPPALEDAAYFPKKQSHTGIPMIDKFIN